MAFPTTSVLTSFTGADENPLSEGGAWAATTVRNGGLVRPRRLSNACASTTGSTNEAVYATNYAADQEAFATVTTLPITGQGPGLFARIQNEGTGTAKGYDFAYTRDTGFRLFHLVSGTFTQVGSTNTTVMGVGDSFGIRCAGTLIECWHKPSAGAWTLLFDEVDSTITGAGKIGVALVDTGYEILDDFGGGVVALQILLPDADIATTGWTTTPLFSKVNDSSDATIITATAA